MAVTDRQRALELLNQLEDLVGPDCYRQLVDYVIGNYLSGRLALDIMTDFFECELDIDVQDDGYIDDL